MPKAGSKRRKKIVTGVLVFCIVAGGGFYYLHSATLRKEAKIREANKDILTATVEKDAIVSTVIGSGTLENGDLEEVLVPVGLVVDEILVKTGDVVEPGQTLATLKPYSVDKALRKEQARLEALDKELEDLESEEGDVALTSPISGRVKTIYANTGADASEICREHGSLLSLSGDGKLALDLPASGLSSGDRVVVEGSSSVNGTVDVIRGRSATITVDDGSFREGETVSVFNRDKSENLGSGRIYIHQPLYLTAPQGTVGKLYVKENALVEAGEELPLLEDAA
ncbi:MAG: efflux RND transporter periplasmic adaptor subunit, partial [Blautia sp.]|nr:efflux RND transporter periplasmic adaptor subunit [Blautia sp.]